MKKALILFAIISIATISRAQNVNPSYNKALADSLGADDYGMKPYVLVILKTGPTKIEDKKKLDSIFRGHFNNIGRLAKKGDLVVAGPLKKNDKTYRGIFILNIKTIEEAKPLLNTDPAVSSGVLDYELFQWYGSAALPMYLPFSEKIEKTKP
ncbi:YciI family protein [Solitalea sp. MAHUQ-68]|uniref:YciI family protein n=1 Tax=Solitalea agri TaxID=2953739 RepID=A0A9X2JC85_9SPHI|nr:YciI family protein [Solitalea agri]MCO4293272.1 YciI family protein [Solitalea agri]